MKKKFLSLLLIAMLCCSAIYIFAGCQGYDADELVVTGETLTFSKQSAESIAGLSINEQVLLASNVGSITLSLKSGGSFSNGETSVTLQQILDKKQLGGGAASGLTDLTKEGSGTLSITYEGYTCQIPYTIG